MKVILLVPYLTLAISQALISSAQAASNHAALYQKLLCIRNRVSTKVPSKQELPPSNLPAIQDLARGSSREALEDFIFSKTNMSQTERASALRELYQNPVNDPGREELLKTVLYDPEYWSLNYGRISTAALTNPELAKIMRPIFELMPQELKDTLVKNISANYASTTTSVAKGTAKPNLSSFWQVTSKAKPELNTTALSPHNEMDAFMNLALRPDAQFRKALEQGTSSKDAYKAFLAKQRSSLYSSSTQGPLDYDEIMKVARAIQSEIPKSLPKEENAIFLSGNFVNGRAETTGNTLSISSASSMIRSKVETLSQKIQETISKSSGTKTAHRPLALSVSSHLPATKRFDSFSLRIKRDEIDLVVHGPYRNDQVYLLENRTIFQPIIDRLSR